MRRLTRGEYALVSPDGKTIAVSKRSGIHTIGPDGRGERLVGRGKPAAWFTDSQHLLTIRGEALVVIDLEDGGVAVVDRGPVAGSVSPNGEKVAYDRFQKTGRPWPCDESSDIYIADLDGTSRRQLTTDGRSSTPVWGAHWIAFARLPEDFDCSYPTPRIWKMRPDGRGVTPIMRTLPGRFRSGGRYGVRPHAWVHGRPRLIATTPTEWGAELALVETRSGKVGEVDLDPRPKYVTAMYVDATSSDGLYIVGAACGAEFPCTIRIYSVARGRARELITGRVAYPHWNR